VLKARRVLAIQSQHPATDRRIRRPLFCGCVAGAAPVTDFDARLRDAHVSPCFTAAFKAST
jgi:hypothetical protein